MRRPSPHVLRVVLFLTALAALVLAFVALVPDALAQHTGGSFGGSDFGGGGGGGGGYSGGGYSGGGYSGGGGNLGGLVYLAFRYPVLFGIGAVIFLIMRASRARADRLPGPEARAWMYIDVTAVRIAVDSTAREFIQTELAKVSRSSTQSRAALLLSLRRVVHLMRKCDAAWIYGGASNFRPMSAPVGEAAFRRLASDARSKFQHELVRNADGKLAESTGPAFTPHSRDGGGVALITIVVAAKVEIIDFDGGSRDAILKVLDQLERLTTEQLIALEVAWSPADPNDRISTATLEAIHPDLKKLPGALGGRVDCKFCRGPYAAELPTCPHCGAPGERPAREE